MCPRQTGPGDLISITDCRQASDILSMDVNHNPPCFRTRVREEMQCHHPWPIEATPAIVLELYLTQRRGRLVASAAGR